MGREGHKTNGMGCLNFHSTKQTFVYFSVVFFGIFSYFYTSAKWIIKTDEYYDDIVIPIEEWEALWCACGWRVENGRCWGEGGMMFFRETALLFKPIDTDFFWNKNIQTVPQCCTSVLVRQKSSLHFSHISHVWVTEYCFVFFFLISVHVFILLPDIKWEAIVTASICLWTLKLQGFETWILPFLSFMCNFH